MAEIFHQKSNKTRSSGTDEVSNSGLGPDSDQSANSFLPHDAARHSEGGGDARLKLAEAASV